MDINDLKDDFGTMEVSVPDGCLFYDVDEDIAVTQKDFDTLDRYLKYMLAGDFTDIVDVFEKEFNVTVTNESIDLGDLTVPLWVSFNYTKFQSQNRYNNFFNGIMSSPTTRKTFMAKSNFKDMITNLKGRKELVNGGSSYFNTLFGVGGNNRIHTEESSQP